MVDYVIETNNLSKKYSNELVVKSIDMHVEKGKIYGLLGKNGAGKTTTMCMLLNLTYPSSGEILLFGKDPRRNSKEIYPKIGSIIETPGFYENLTASMNESYEQKIKKQKTEFEQKHKKLTEEACQLNHRIKDLLKKQEELDRIKRSNGYKALKIYYKIRDFFI